MKIGDKVTYAEENVALDDIHGEVVEPTDEERNEAHGGPIDPYSDVMIAWDDGQRYWEDPAELVVIQEAGS